MLFNSLDFAIFLPIVFLLYWFVFNKKIKQQNFFILVASYFFYGWWDWRYLSLIIFSSLVDYWVGIQLSKTETKLNRIFLLATSIVVNLGFLACFKYYDFFIESFVDAFHLLGQPIEASRLNLVLPVGISFYTFQTMSYSIDVYRRKLQPTRDLISFFAYVSFFPQLVAGPIERALHLLPQFAKKRNFDYQLASNGLLQMLWGAFKKIVIADNCAVMVNDIFQNYTTLPSSVLVMGAIYFAFQIYGDFSGYSDIAIGCSKLFGFELMTNFAFPYFSRDIAEFWRRWHISLSTWFRDYLYIPIGGSKGSIWKQIRNVLIVFIVSGFWHGANWTFLAWGTLNGLFFLPLLLAKVNRKNLEVNTKSFLPSFKELTSILLTFSFTCLAWVFFRAQNISEAVSYLAHTFTKTIISVPTSHTSVLPVVVLFIFMEWYLMKKDADLLIILRNFPSFWRTCIILIIGMVVFLQFNPNPTSFIYFQF